MARTKLSQALFKSQVIYKLLERLPALHPWPKNTHDWYTKPLGSEVKLGIWNKIDFRVPGQDLEVACDLAWEYLESNFPEELEQLLDDGLGDSDSDEETGTHLGRIQSKLIKKKYLIQEVERKFPGVFGNRGLGDADPVNLLANRIMNEGPNRPLEWIFSEIERALPDARKVAGAMIEINEEVEEVEKLRATLLEEKQSRLEEKQSRLDRLIEIKEQTEKLEQEMKKVEEECNFWREQTLRLSKEVPADDETMARLGWTTEYK